MSLTVTHCYTLFCVTNCNTLLYIICHQSVQKTSVLNVWKHNSHFLLTVLAIYSNLILSGNYHWSLLAAIMLCMWASGWQGYVNMPNEPTGSGNQLLADKTRTIYNTNDALWQHGTQFSISQFHGHYVLQDAVSVTITTDIELTHTLFLLPQPVAVAAPRYSTAQHAPVPYLHNKINLTSLLWTCGVL